VTPLADLIAVARQAAQPTVEERRARASRRATAVTQGITQEELATRCRALGHHSVIRETIARAERVGPREPTLAAICDALGLDVALVKRKAQR
jgi:hypothetical protein